MENEEKEEKEEERNGQTRPTVFFNSAGDWATLSSERKLADRCEEGAAWGAWGGWRAMPRGCVGAGPIDATAEDDGGTWAGAVRERDRALMVGGGGGGCQVSLPRARSRPMGPAARPWPPRRRRSGGRGVPAEEERKSERVLRARWVGQGGNRSAQMSAHRSSPQDSPQVREQGGEAPPGRAPWRCRRPATWYTARPRTAPQKEDPPPPRPPFSSPTNGPTQEKNNNCKIGTH